MRVELQNIVLIGLGTTVDMEKLQAKAESGENIGMNINSILLFPEPGRVECRVTLETGPEAEAIRLRCTYQGTFSLFPDADEIERELIENEQTKISAMCTAKMFPYLRELVVDVTRRLPMAAPIALHPALGDENALLNQARLQPPQFRGKEETQQ